MPPLIDAQVTNFQNGVNNRVAGSIFGAMKQMDPTRFHTFFEDFDYFTAADWTFTDVGAATQALADADGGVLLITNAAADNNSSFANKVGESFLFEAGKQLFFAARFAVSDATESDVVCGLQITDTTPLDVSDGIFFLKGDGGTALALIAEKDGTQVTLEDAALVLADDTFIELSFYWDGIDRIWVGVNGTAVAVMTPGASLPDDEILTLSFGIQNGEAVAKTMSVDYLFVAKER